MDKESVCEVGQNGSDAVDTPPADGEDKAAKIKKIKRILLITLCVIVGVIVLGVIVFAPIVAKGNKVIVPDEHPPRLRAGELDVLSVGRHADYVYGNPRFARQRLL